MRVSPLTQFRSLAVFIFALFAFVFFRRTSKGRAGR
jgi:hypothetical protein